MEAGGRATGAPAGRRRPRMAYGRLASSSSSAAAAVAPRAAAWLAACSSSRASSASAPRLRRALGAARTPPDPSTQLGQPRVHRRGACPVARGRRRATRAAGGRTGIVEPSTRTIRSRTATSSAARLSCPRAGPAVGRASAAASSSTFCVGSGSRAMRPPSSARRLAGTRTCVLRPRRPARAPCEEGVAARHAWIDARARSPKLVTRPVARAAGRR